MPYLLLITLLLLNTVSFATPDQAFTSTETDNIPNPDSTSISPEYFSHEEFLDLVLRMAPLIHHGFGTHYFLEREYEQAHHWFAIAAQQGHYPSYANLGVLYSSGLGVKQNPEEAIYWLILAGEAGREHLKILLEASNVQKFIFKILRNLLNQKRLSPEQVQDALDSLELGHLWKQLQIELNRPEFGCKMCTFL